MSRYKIYTKFGCDAQRSLDLCGSWKNVPAQRPIQQTVRSLMPTTGNKMKI